MTWLRRHLSRSQVLGLVFLAPALILVFMFFLVPVVLTGVFAFTNMSTATGIKGGAYAVTENALHDLRDHYGLGDLAEKLSESTYTVDEAGLAALKDSGDASPALLDEFKRTLLGKTFADNREMERAIKDLNNRPRSIRTIKKITEIFKRSVFNSRFDSRQALLSAVAGSGVKLTPKQVDALAAATYTGWSWTTENFKRMFTMPDTTRILSNTVFYVFFTLMIFNVGFALFLAIVMHYLPERPAGFFRAVWLLPRITPSVLYVLLWKWLAWDTGFLSQFLAPFGVAPRNWMLDTSANAWTFVFLINGFVGASMGMLIFSAAIRSIPDTLFYASEVDGASRWQQVRMIILPQLRWPILFITCYQTLSLLTSFEHILADRPTVGPAARPRSGRWPPIIRLCATMPATCNTDTARRWHWCWSSSAWPCR